jgi:mono/diheme cytochrome c family protein
MKPMSIGLATAAFALLLGLPSAAQAPDQQTVDIYLHKCAVCHARDGSGNTAKGRKEKVKPAWDPVNTKLTETEQTERITKGKGDMDGYGKEYSPAQIKALAGYMRYLAAQHSGGSAK